MIIHIVNTGETFEQIALQYGVSLQNLAADNGIAEGQRPAVGQALVVQIPSLVHTVERGDTLTSVAKRYNTTAINLLRNNFKLGGVDKIKVGEEIVIEYKNERRNKTFATNSYAYPVISTPLLRAQLPYLTYFTPFTYGITADGNAVILNDGELIRIAKEYGTKTLLHLSTLTENGNFSSERASLVFNNPRLQARLIDELVGITQEKGFDGADVDFEFINPSEKYDYIRFLQELRLSLEPLGLPLFSALAPKTSDNQSGTLYEGHDYSGIGAAVNYVLLMTYEWGYTFGPPMAVAPLNRVQEVASYAATRISASKLFLGVPTYGYDWTLPYARGGSGAPSLSPVDATRLAAEKGVEIMYDETAQAPWFRYTDDDGRLHEVWFEDARSISAKLSLAEKLNMFGIGYWNSMRSFPQNWIVLNSNYNITNFSLM